MSSYSEQTTDHHSSQQSTRRCPPGFVFPEPKTRPHTHAGLSDLSLYCDRVIASSSLHYRRSLQLAERLKVPHRHRVSIGVSWHSLNHPQVHHHRRVATSRDNYVLRAEVVVAQPLQKAAQKRRYCGGYTVEKRTGTRSTKKQNALYPPPPGSNYDGPEVTTRDAVTYFSLYFVLLIRLI